MKIIIVQAFLLVLRLFFPLLRVEGCSPPRHYRPVGLIGRAILAPNIIIGRVDTIKSDGDPFFVPYTACVTIKRVLKNVTKLPEKLCISEFGGEELCLLHVEVNKTYVMFLNQDNSARYDDLHGAAHLAVDSVVNLIEEGLCKDGECETPSLNFNWKNNITVKEGKSLELTCQPSGTTPYLITWLWNNNHIGMRILTDSVNRLEIKQISSRWSGKFTCVVRSPAGEISRSTEVHVDPIPCGGNMIIEPKQTPFAISSLNFPSRYPRDKICKWKVCPPKGYKLKLTFTDFTLIGEFDDVEISFECRKNKTVQKHLWGRFCGTTLPEEVTSTCRSNCVLVTHNARLGKTTFQENSAPILHNAFGFKTIFTAVRKEKTNENEKKLFSHYDFIIKGRVKTNGITSLIIEVLKTYLPVNTDMGKEMRIHYSYPLMDQRNCLVSLDQGGIYIFLGVDTGIFHDLIDVYQEHEIRHQWINNTIL